MQTKPGLNALQEGAAVGHEGEQDSKLDSHQKVELTNFSKEKRIIICIYFYIYFTYQYPCSCDTVVTLVNAKRCLAAPSIILVTGSVSPMKEKVL